MLSRIGRKLTNLARLSPKHSSNKTIDLPNSRITKRRENDVDEEEDNASRDNTDVAPTPETERPAERKYNHLLFAY